METCQQPCVGPCGITQSTQEAEKRNPWDPQAITNNYSCCHADSLSRTRLIEHSGHDNTQVNGLHHLLTQQGPGDGTQVGYYAKAGMALGVNHPDN